MKQKLLCRKKGAKDWSTLEGQNTEGGKGKAHTLRGWGVKKNQEKNVWLPEKKQKKVEYCGLSKKRKPWEKKKIIGGRKRKSTKQMPNQTLGERRGRCMKSHVVLNKRDRQHARE